MKIDHIIHDTCLLHLSTVKHYDWLVNGTAQAQVEDFMKENHSFDEYTKVTQWSQIDFIPVNNFMQLVC